MGSWLGMWRETLPKGGTGVVGWPNTLTFTPSGHFKLFAKSNRVLVFSILSSIVWLVFGLKLPRFYRFNFLPLPVDVFFAKFSLAVNLCRWKRSYSISREWISRVLQQVRVFDFSVASHLTFQRIFHGQNVLISGRQVIFKITISPALLFQQIKVIKWAIMSNLLHIKEPKVGFPYRRHRRHQHGLFGDHQSRLPVHPPPTPPDPIHWLLHLSLLLLLLARTAAVLCAQSSTRRVTTLRLDGVTTNAPDKTYR